jgi:hypothetical protein
MQDVAHQCDEFLRGHVSLQLISARKHQEGIVWVVFTAPVQWNEVP